MHGANHASFIPVVETHSDDALEVAAPRGPSRPDGKTQALIEEARRRQRRRRRLVAVLVLVTLGVGAAAYVVIVGTGARHSAAFNHRTGGTPGSAAAIRLESPSALAVGPSGGLYIADDGRNQILERLRDGRFMVVAGSGKRGFAGDGGRAVDSELNAPGGMAFATNGTLYFADEGNNRVRAISPRGIISTVAGNGKIGWVRSGTPALAASLGGPAAVTIGPRHRLYIAAETWGEVLRLSANGILTRIAGITGPHGVLSGIGRPATKASADGANGLAFDRSGNLYLAGFNTKTLLMVTPDGTMMLPAGKDGFYPRGPGGLVTAPDGSVLAMNNLQIVRLSPRGVRTILDLGERNRVEGISGFLPDGIAVGRHGEIYVDTWLGNGFTNKTALVEIRPGARVRVLWKS